MRDSNYQLVDVKDVVFRYRQGSFCLTIPELTITAGQSAAIIGPSGSGKTTLLHLIAGILTTATGRITITDEDLSAMNEKSRRRFRLQRIGLIFQEFELLAHLNVLDNILLAYRIHGDLILDNTVRQRAKALAEEMGIGDKLKRYVHHLSQGERQRVAICRALLHEPPLLLCDEPTGNLDPLNKEHVLDVLFDYVQRHQTTLLTVTHNHDILTRFDRVIDFKDFYRLDQEDAHA